LSDLSDLRRLLALYAQRLDDRNVDGLVALFTQDATVESPSGVYKGHAQIRQWLEGFFAEQLPGLLEQNQLVNPVLTVSNDGKTAVGRTDQMCFRSMETTPWELEVVMRHHDRFAKLDGEWYFSDKAIEMRGGFKRTANPVPNAVSID
jgi:hypothetical protein